MFLRPISGRSPCNSSCTELNPCSCALSPTDCALPPAIADGRNIVGHESFRLVYRGALADGRKVAVKLMDSGGKQGEEEFKMEVIAFMEIHQPFLLMSSSICACILYKIEANWDQITLIRFLHLKMLEVC